MRFEFFAIFGKQRRPVQIDRDGALLAEHSRAFVVHFQEEKIRELLDVIAIGDAVIPQHVTVIPDALDNRGRLRIHKLYYKGYTERGNLLSTRNVNLSNDCIRDD
jgi:hypothetical protein